MPTLQGLKVGTDAFFPICHILWVLKLLTFDPKLLYRVTKNTPWQVSWGSLMTPNSQLMLGLILKLNLVLRMKWARVACMYAAFTISILHFVSKTQYFRLKQRYMKIFKLIYFSRPFKYNSHIPHFISTNINANKAYFYIFKALSFKKNHQWIKVMRLLVHFCKQNICG